MAANSSYLDTKVMVRKAIPRNQSDMTSKQANEYLDNSSMMSKRVPPPGRHDSNPTALKNLKYI